MKIIRPLFLAVNICVNLCPIFFYSQAEPFHFLSTTIPEDQVPTA